MCLSILLGRPTRSLLSQEVIKTPFPFVPSCRRQEFYKPLPMGSLGILIVNHKVEQLLDTFKVSLVSSLQL